MTMPTERKTDRWMPLDWGDYWRDTGHLKAAEHGAYLNLLGQYWVSGKPLPDDDERLHRLARMTRPEWKRVASTVRAFFRAADGLLHHKRVEREIKRAHDVSLTRSRAAVHMHSKRKAKHQQNALQSQPPSQDSVPVGTGARAPLSAAADVDVFGAEPAASLKSRIFGPCLAWLAAQAKLSEPAARKITAKWCAGYGDGAVLDAFAAAARQSPLDPVPYIEKVLSNAKSSSGDGQAPLRRGAAEPFQARVASVARAQATGHLTGLRDALGLGDVAAARPDAAYADGAIVVDADCQLK
jgi:uncharacterized protein YdaU (DUF1376 family)